MHVLQVMPRNMYFGSSLATSIDLCVRDLVAASRFKDTTTVLGERVDDPFPNLAFDEFPQARRAATFSRANHVARRVRRERPDVIIVQQHLPTAAAIARRVPTAKIIFHTHNIRKARKIDGTLKSRVRRILHKHSYSRLAGIVQVSEACADKFDRDWPEVSTPREVVTNGLDFAAWRPAPKRTHEILRVARCVPEKGVLEAAQAVGSVLPEVPEWRTRFILSGTSVRPDYFSQVRETLAPLGPQATIEVQQPWERVKQANEQAAIAVVPSVCAEAFGRTALEAHAGGAALISSGTGGLPEVSGENALMLPEVSSAAIAEAVRTLITSRGLRHRLASQGALRARERFDIRVQAARMDDFLLRVVECGQRSFDRAFQLPRVDARVSTGSEVL